MNVLLDLSRLEHITLETFTLYMRRVAPSVGEYAPFIHLQAVAGLYGLLGTVVPRHRFVTDALATATTTPSGARNAVGRERGRRRVGGGLVREALPRRLVQRHPDTGPRPAVAHAPSPTRSVFFFFFPGSSRG